MSTRVCAVLRARACGQLCATVRPRLRSFPSPLTRSALKKTGLVRRSAVLDLRPSHPKTCYLAFASNLDRIGAHLLCRPNSFQFVSTGRRGSDVCEYGIWRRRTESDEQ